MGKIFGFLRESWAELKNVVWPTRKQAVRLTLTVLAITFGVAGFAALLDYVFSRMLNFLVSK
ncbi:MAG: preprotein translocase subunit SecE, preprotein translocase subunit SecE [candidate division WWE3 bacterium CSP1-7]|jgi:preprotein translocase SecE subunit|uniref:Protein translocase subunit SecE n=2 Tax=Katanobacteria TaxID=422282 RepID=A0A1F4WEF9_UNCKA|nr:MAG: preprotein translocase subunit SecE, preprotein translocase subunit SecE [candidate division WWE3 bacterium CSP1-7]OGC67799.1 MAG: preprotein translocase subunit SecE [candidate division WWE3 bacterium RIFCSPLOWO2_02_FULL_53_10]